jgi:hypothetical protein
MSPRKKPTTDDDQPCAICQSPSGYANRGKHTINGLPVGVPACEECRTAILNREVGVTRRADGSLSITDGRKKDDDAPVECCSERFTLDDIQEQPYVCTLAPGHPGPHHDEIANMESNGATPTDAPDLEGSIEPSEVLRSF